MSLHTAENGAVTMSKARHHVCIEVAWELEVLAYMLPTVTNNADDDAVKSSFAVRGIASRVVSLANVLMSALGDDAEKTKDLECQLRVIPPGAD